MQVVERRRVGVRINPERLDREMARRGVDAQTVARKAQLSASTLSSARRGNVTEKTWRKLSEALSSFPVLELADSLLESDEPSVPSEGSLESERD